MAKQSCPACGKSFPVETGWANATVALLMPAPAIPDMATQVSCPHCHHVFSNSEVRYLASSWGRGPVILVALLCVSLLAWAVYQLF